MNSMVSEPLDLFGLQRQHRELGPEILRRIEKLLVSARFVGGEPVERFCQQFSAYLNVSHVIPCNSGTDALIGTLRCLRKVRNSSEQHHVLVSPFTFVASVEAIVQAGFVPVFVDIDIDTFLMDPEFVHYALWNDPRIAPGGILAVHLFGQGVNMEVLLEESRKRNVWIVEDCAQATGARICVEGTWKPAGTLGIAGCFSFYPTKNLGACGDAGCVVTHSAELAECIHRYFSHGEGANRYWSEAVGTNSRLDAWQAAILNYKLGFLEKWNQVRSALAHRYRERLQDVSEIQLPQEVRWSTHVYHLFVVRVREGKEVRKQLQEYLARHQIATGVYYPWPVSDMPPYQKFIRIPEELPSAHQAANEVLALPLHPWLSEEEVDRIAENIRRFFGYSATV